MNQKPSFLSSSFIVLVLTQIINLYLAFSSIIPDAIAQYVAAGAAGGYILSRGIGKIGAHHDSSKKRFWQTSEFYVVAIMSGQIVASGLTDVIPPDKMAMITGALGSLYMLARSMSKIGNPLPEFEGKNIGQILDAARKAGMILIFFAAALAFAACNQPGPTDVPIEPAEDAPTTGTIDVGDPPLVPEDSPTTGTIPTVPETHYAPEGMVVFQ